MLKNIKVVEGKLNTTKNYERLSKDEVFEFIKAYCDFEGLAIPSKNILTEDEYYYTSGTRICKANCNILCLLKDIFEIEIQKELKFKDYRVNNPYTGCFGFIMDSDWGFVYNKDLNSLSNVIIAFRVGYFDIDNVIDNDIENYNIVTVQGYTRRMAVIIMNKYINKRFNLITKFANIDESYAKEIIDTLRCSIMSRLEKLYISEEDEPKRVCVNSKEDYVYQVCNTFINVRVKTMLNLTDKKTVKFTDVFDKFLVEYVVSRLN